MTNGFPSSSKASHLPRFSADVRTRWVVKRDQAGDEFIRLNGKQAMGNGGQDHIYLISQDRLGVWLTTRQIEGKFKRLCRLVPGLAIEQLGDGEGVFSCNIEHLERLCKAVGAKRRKEVSEGMRSHLANVRPSHKNPESPTKSPSGGPFACENDGGEL